MKIMGESLPVTVEERNVFENGNDIKRWKKVEWKNILHTFYGCFQP